MGLGNIAGVAFAVHLGGPGSILWMILAGILGMSSKFAECTLGQHYRVQRSDGRVSGGPMHYLADGLKELGWKRLGHVLSISFAVLCIGASFGAGNMFQANQSYVQLADVLPLFSGHTGALIFGLAIIISVGLVIIGGIKRIGEVASYLVPGMCALYMVCGFAVLLERAAHLGDAVEIIIKSAFDPGAAAWGGLVAVVIQGFRRAAFSNEAGVGSSPIAHAAATTDEPIREGIVAMLEPFIDTVVVCTVTGLVIVVTGAYLQPELEGGIQITSWAFGSVFSWSPILLSVTALLFAFSTMISWSYYGEQCWVYLFGSHAMMTYKVLFLMFALLGVLINSSSVLKFGDLMLLGMAFPNMLGMLLLSGKVKDQLSDYWARLQSGQIRRTS